MSYRRHKMMASQRMVEVEYILFTGDSRRINTGLYISEEQGAVACKFHAVNTVERQYRLVSSLNNEASFQVYKNGIDGVSYSAGDSWVSGGRIFNCGVGGYVEFNIDWYHKTAKIYNSGQNGVNTQTINKVSTNIIGPIGFGGSGFANSQIYYINFSKNGELVFDAIPVRVGKKGYFYDRITDSLFGDGVGLVPGPDKTTQL